MKRPHKCLRLGINQIHYFVCVPLSLKVFSDHFIFYFHDTISREEHKSHLVRLKDLWDGFIHLPAFFCPRKVNLKIPSINAGLLQNGTRSSPEDGFRVLVSSNPLLRFRLVLSWDLANLGKSSSGIWPFLISHLPGFGHSR